MTSQLFKIQSVVLFLFVLIGFCPVEAKMTKFNQRKLSKASVEAILKRYKVEASHVSLEILSDEKSVYSLNENVQKIPASISKILTSYAVLKKLTASHHFYTKLFWDGQNLYLKGGGDPSFVSENMWFLVNEFSRSGIKKIKGDIIVDDTLFDRVRFDESRESTRVDRAYDAPVGAMSFNWNSVNVFVKPTTALQKARVIVDPENQYFDLVNNTITVSGNVKKELTVQISNAERLITVSGEVQVGAPEKAIFKNIDTPDLWSGANLKFFLAQRGISVDGKVRTGIVPQGAEQVAVFESKNFAYIMADMNKFSNNFVAEMLTKNIAAVEVNSEASLARGVQGIQSELKKIGLDEKQIKIVNPSGLTRDNTISAHSMNLVLREIKNDFSIYTTFTESLPIAGIDGTLKKRFKESPAEGWVRAKTGYLSGVVALAGYAGRSDGEVLTFSFLYNGPRDEGQVREAFDQIVLNSLQ
jgi:serine-type D-Ala-D-Ala carboxypeptidase/endopeptidase (penicillin-binding protein 4)